MEIHFCGGAQTVTGSQFVIHVNGKNLLLECGLFQGKRQESYDKNVNFLYDPASISSLILSHAHIDHSGNIPNLTKKGFTGSIYATPPTVDLCKIMLKDSAYLQERDVFWVNRIHSRQNQPLVAPIYTIADAEKCLDSFVGIDFDRTFTVAPDVSVTFRDAGHILGSASILMEISEKGKNIRFGFTGDIGRPNMPVMHDPNVLWDLDALMIESTYGDRHHNSYEDVEEELAETIREVSKNGGKVLIPAFAVGRTQLIVYIIHKLFDQDRIPEIPIYVDSPMACHATDVFREYPDYFDRETHRIFLDDNSDPFEFRRLTYVQDVEESKRLNGLSFPHVIISSSGMLEGGRILHHLKNNVENPKCLVLFVGYSAQHTLARKMTDGEKSIKILGEDHKVRCKVRVMDSFSAHADRRDILEYIKMTPPSKLKNIFLVHGEPDQTISLQNALRSMGYPNVYYPRCNEKFVI
jgi:metallo-beta-lactamase family protein